MSNTSQPTIPLEFPRDDEYYMTNVVFLVEGHLFNVPRYYFARNSDIFASVFSLPPRESTSQEGSGDENPFKLEGVSKEDFKSLLRVIYPLQTPHIGSEPTLPIKDWISALKLATMWNFLDIRRLAISKLSNINMGPVEKVILAKEYKVQEWLLFGYHELVRRTATITIDEAARLGLETTVHLFQIREQIAASDYHYGYRRREELDYTELVRGSFKKELKDIQAASAAYDSILIE